MKQWFWCQSVSNGRLLCHVFREDSHPKFGSDIGTDVTTYTPKGDEKVYGLHKWSFPVKSEKSLMLL